MSKNTGYKKSWYKEWFGEDYLTVYQHRDDNDAKQLLQLVLSNISIDSNTYLLDLACGNGRHAYLISKYTKHVFGLDLSRYLLLAAQTKKKENVSPAFVQADMRFFPFKISFDVIFSLFTSFGYFDDDKKHLRVAREISNSLKPGGHFVIDYFNPDYVRKNLVAKGKRQIGEIEILEERWISDSRVHKNIHIHKENSDKIFRESVRLFELDEMKAILNSANIVIERVFGNYDGSKYHKESKRMIIFASKNE